MDEDFIGDSVRSPKKAKSVMWYVGYIIAVGIIGITVALLLMQAVFLI